jgi:hypothetical protein
MAISSSTGHLPYLGPASPLYSTAYPKPALIYLTSFFVWLCLAVLRYGIALSCLDVLVYWGSVDNLLFFQMTAVLAYHIFISHHRWRYVDAKPFGDVQPSEVTHCLGLLVANEPEEQLLKLAADLKALPCQGKKVLIIGMEKAATKEPEAKIAAIQKLNEQPGGKPFDEILYTLHELRDQEIIGTGSNHYEVQVAAERHFEDASNVILSKFDVNMQLDSDRKLLQEIESIWCSVDQDTRFSITFMPNVVWSANVPDLERTTIEKIVSFGMSSSSCVAPFSMSFVSGSLQGICAAGYTPPSLLSEDELAFTKKQLMLPRPTTYRLCSVILKVFVTSKEGNVKFLWDFLDKKLKRWFIGWLEVQYYTLTWIFARGQLSTVGAQHPPVLDGFRAFHVFLLCFERMYMAFVMPVSFVPMAFVWFAAYARRADWMEKSNGDSYYGELLELQFTAFVITFVVNMLIAVRVTSRLYKSFDCLKFHWSTPLICLVGSLVFMVFPIFLLWTYLKHGLLNMPAGHVVVCRASTKLQESFHSFRRSFSEQPRSPSAREIPREGAGVLLEMEAQL